MLKTRIILIVVSAAIVWLLFLLPKAVVENEGQMEAEEGQEVGDDPHTTTPAALRESINSLNAQYLEASGNEKSAIFADSLASMYSEAGQYSLAWKLPENYSGKLNFYLKTKEGVVWKR